MSDRTLQRLPYERFFLISSLHRSGTTWLWKMIQMCSGADVYDEVFHQLGSNNWVYESECNLEHSLIQIYRQVLAGELRKSDPLPRESLYIRPSIDPNTSLCVIKENNLITKIRMVLATIPQMQPVFLFRHPLKSFESLSHAVSQKPLFSSNVHPIWPSDGLLDRLIHQEPLLKDFPILNREIGDNTDPEFRLGMVYGILHRLMLDMAIQDRIPCLFYEYITENPIGSVSKLLEHWQIPMRSEAIPQINQINSFDSGVRYDWQRVSATKRLTNDTIRDLADCNFMHGYHSIVPELYRDRVISDNILPSELNLEPAFLYKGENRMDYSSFHVQLPHLYKHWQEESVQPQSDRFQGILEQVEGMTTANIMQLLNFAAASLKLGEVYCEVGCFQGATLIGTLLERPHVMAYGVDNFCEADPFGENLDKLTENLINFGIDEQVCFCQQSFEEFFQDLTNFESEDKIGVYFYDGAQDYRSILMSLLLVKPFLARQALLIVISRNQNEAAQGIADFLATTPECRLRLSLPEFSREDTINSIDGVYVMMWDAIHHHQPDWDNIESLNNPDFLNCLYALKKNRNASLINSIYREACNLQEAGSFDEAKKKYQQLLQIEDRNFNAWFNLGMLYYTTQNYDRGLNLLSKALEVDDSQALIHYGLGVILEKQARLSEAIDAYQQAIECDRNFIDAYNNLGNIWYKDCQFDRAEEIYRQAIAIDTSHSGSYLNLGNALIAQEKIEDAIEIYQTALQFNPDDPNLLENSELAVSYQNNKSLFYFDFGNYFYQEGQYAKAISQFENFLEIDKESPGVYLVLLKCFNALKQQNKAIESLERGTREHPDFDRLHYHLIQALVLNGETETAIEKSDVALQLMPESLCLKFQRFLLLPVLYKSFQEIKFYRQKFIQGLSELVQSVSLDTAEAKKEAITAISLMTNFYLSYQGCNDLEPQKQYGQLVRRIMAANYPEWIKPRSMPPLAREEKIRIGYISFNMGPNRLGELVLGWLHNCDRKKFEIHCYYLGKDVDTLTHKFKNCSDRFYQINEDLKKVCEQIISDRLHVLVFIEIGLHPLIAKIASLRLAPVQCTTWVHPVTSGLTTIDYFLSSELMEPENGQEHYSEKLVRLPNIGICYPKPSLPELSKNRADFGIRDGSIVYLACQSLFKYLPQYDRVFVEIVRQVPQVQFVFLSNPHSRITEVFQKRLKNAFSRFDLNSEDYCVMLPRLDELDYLNVNLLSDIFLDSFSWSGGITTLKAIACSLPVVTCPGEFMRGRHTYGILKMLGQTDTIAKTETEYIEIAVKLGLDSEWRRDIAKQTVAGHESLYYDRECVTGLEDFYQRVVRERLIAN
ncbi:MAG: tetratricopeptide repeat protein [Cyanobacteriota bacterium]|nr:tetratricopeptide repeat protein [Cyanobacteriota bacterium]